MSDMAQNTTVEESCMRKEIHVVFEGVDATVMHQRAVTVLLFLHGQSCEAREK